MTYRNFYLQVGDLVYRTWNEKMVGLVISTDNTADTSRVKILWSKDSSVSEEYIGDVERFKE